MEEGTVIKLVVIGLFTPVGWILMGVVFGGIGFIIDEIRNKK